MKKAYHDILYDENGNSIPLSADDFIEYLLQNLYQLKSENDSLKNKLNGISSILETDLNNNDKSNSDF